MDQIKRIKRVQKQAYAYTILLYVLASIAFLGIASGGLGATIFIFTHGYSSNFLATVAVIGISIGAFTSPVTGKYTDLLWSVIVTKDIHIIGTLLDAMRMRTDKLIITNSTLVSPRRELTLLLPRLQPSDADLLTDKQRAFLYTKLMDNDVAFVLSILTALEQIGDSKALPYVEQLATGHGRASSNDALREAAKTCLSILQERANRNKTPQTLLPSTEEPG